MYLYPNVVDDDVDQYRRNVVDQVSTISCYMSSEQHMAVQIMSLLRNHKLKQLNPEQWMVYFTKMVFQQAFFTVIKTPKKSSLQVLLGLYTEEFKPSVAVFASASSSSTH